MAEVKRGYRKLVVIVPVAIYDLLTKQAEDNDREVGQQATFLLRKVLSYQTNMAAEYQPNGAAEEAVATVATEE